MDECQISNRICYCLNTTSSHVLAALREGHFPTQGFRTYETIIMEGVGVVVGDWVEWWSGMGWSGGRGWGGVMVGDVVSVGQGVGECQTIHGGGSGQGPGLMRLMSWWRLVP